MSIQFIHLTVLAVGIAFAITGCGRPTASPGDTRPALNAIRLETIVVLPASAKTENAPRNIDQHQKKETPCN